MRLSLPLGLAALLVLSACSPKTETAATPSATPTPEGPVGAVLTTSPEITAEDFAARLKELADDKYEGRGPGTVTGEAAATWIASEMKRIGLEPGNNGDWYQTVEMVGQTVDGATSSLAFTANGKQIAARYGDDTVFFTKRQKDSDATVSFADSDMVFVGYGVNAPEQNWNDYAGLDVKGKTVVMFVNDPGFITNDAKLFSGKAMTYYGRWTYKYEEAARQGATAAIIIHETAPASYGWDVVSTSWSGEQADLVDPDGGADQSLLDGWVTLEKATELFKAAGLDIDKQRAAANKRGFKAVPMEGLKASATIHQTIKHAQSRNVVGTLKGSERPDEHVLLMGHWDHLGKSAPDGDKDVINNGAVDNASGVSAILEIAENLKNGPPPKRSVTILAVTLEESGLLGSAYFGEHPFIPLNKIVAGLNLDALLPIGRTKDQIVIGYGASQLEDILKDILAKQKRVAVPDPEPQAGYFYRSDHISLAKKGVPMLYVDGGVDKIEGGSAEGKKSGEDYRTNRYHNPADEFDPAWDMSGQVEDLNVWAELTSRIADSADWPTWYKGNEFEAARKASLAGK